MNFKLFAMITLFAINSQAIMINCLETNDFQKLCSSIVDESKVEYVNCLDGSVKDSYERRLCENTHWIDESGQDAILNCFEATLPEYSLEHKVCSGIPKEETINRINCTGELEDGYQAIRCENVDTVEQEFINKLLLISSEGLIQTQDRHPQSEISCIGELEDGFNFNWCQKQISNRHTSCEDAALEGLQSYFDMKLIEAHGLSVFEVVGENDTYKIGYAVGPFEVLNLKTVLVTDNAHTCYAVEIQ